MAMGTALKRAGQVELNQSIFAVGIDLPQFELVLNADGDYALCNSGSIHLMYPSYLDVLRARPAFDVPFAFYSTGLVEPTLSGVTDEGGYIYSMETYSNTTLTFADATWCEGLGLEEGYYPPTAWAAIESAMTVTARWAKLGYGRVMAYHDMYQTAMLYDTMSALRFDADADLEEVERMAEVSRYANTAALEQKDQVSAFQDSVTACIQEMLASIYMTLVQTDSGDDVIYLEEAGLLSDGYGADLLSFHSVLVNMNSDIITEMETLEELLL
ncbi:hypothetical protein KIPB_010314, partial [Kipferlia bialata]|eukprot:g10314.t1